MAKKYVSEVHLTNHKKHKELSLKINGNHFIISGNNGDGKSTIFGVIMASLGVLPDNLVPDVDLTTGEESGSKRVILVDGDQEYEWERKFTKKGPGRIKFSRIAKDGEKDLLEPAMDRVKKIFGHVLDLSPLIDMSGDKQFDHLRKAFNVDIEGYKIDRKNKFESRTVINNRIKALTAVLNAPETKVFPADKELYAEPKDVKELMEKKIPELPIQELLTADAQVLQKRRTLAQNIDQLDAQIKALEAQRDAAKNALKVMATPDLEVTRKKLTDAQEFNATVDIEIQEMSKHNEMHIKVKNFIQNEELLKKEQAAAAALTTDLKQMDTDLKGRLKEIPFSTLYEGLDLKYEVDPETNKVTEIGLYLNGLPFNRGQQSMGEMIKCLIMISTFINPDGLNFVYIGDWDKLDDRNKDEILKFAEENPNVQLGIEKVDNTSKIEITFIGEPLKN